MLSENVQFSQYASMNGAHEEGEAREHDGLSAEQEDSLAKYCLSTKTRRFWAGSGGCVLVISVIITWLLQHDVFRDIRYSRLRGTAAVVLFALVTLYLYALARRKALRHVRAQALHVVQSAINRSQKFDIACNRCMGMLQEVELLARGYGNTSTPLPPVSRMSQANMGPRETVFIKRSLMHSIAMATAAYTRCSDVLREFCAPQNLAKIEDVYSALDEEGDLLPDDGDDSEFELSLTGLKLAFHRMHSMRRHAFCALLAMEVGRGESHTLRVASTHLQAASRLVDELGDELERCVERHISLADALPARVLASPRPGSLASRSYALGFMNMTSTLRRTQAKLLMLRSQALKLEGEGLSGLAGQYNSLGADIRALLDDWEQGRALFRDHGSSPAVTPFTVSACAFSPSLASSMPTLSQDTSNDDDRRSDGSPSRGSGVGDWGNPLTPQRQQQKQFVFETFGQLPRPGHTVLSRQERIELMRREREDAAKRALESRSRGSMVSELKDVLVRRAEFSPTALPPRDSLPLREDSGYG